MCVCWSLWGREAERLKANGNHGVLCAALVLAETNSTRGGGCRKKKIKLFRVRFFVFFFLMLSKLPPLGFELKAVIYRQSVFSGFKIGPSIFEFGP